MTIHLKEYQEKKEQWAGSVLQTLRSVLQLLFFIFS